LFEERDFNFKIDFYLEELAWNSKKNMAEWNADDTDSQAKTRMIADFF
jgi:hypothetical protein